jgi:hypothetical protein
MSVIPGRPFNPKGGMTFPLLLLYLFVRGRPSMNKSLTTTLLKSDGPSPYFSFRRII